jgi:hypothetical protein
MRKLLLAAILTGAAFAAQPATAAIVFDSVGDTSGTINFNGIVDGNVQPGLTSSLFLTLTGLNTTTGVFTFSYNLTNTSSAPITASRVSGFGFNTTPNASATGHSVTGEFDTVTLNGNVPQLGNFEICVSDVNCAGGASGGPTFGNSGTGSLTLNFADGTSSISLDDFYVRYQSIVGSAFGDSGSGEDIPPPPIPEAATWMMMLAGFGAIGYATRRRRRMTVSFA